MIWIDYEKCTNCKKCLHCPQGVFEDVGYIIVANPEYCNGCCYCVQVCEVEAVHVDEC
ncbi:4Fe-4S dicluster domain-containing protein [Archaeoglobus profundus]|uniref:4Fe-4S ferredoxin iron-sulfur binding domain protein n=1 Tax=Archaeoglobus profundus (strain DSM 5631 / JCM 9629 / NBRC 100127 / Av18) TaxID=572546 RepID=D2RHB5_ARCPA|nr:4Fe-4S dicluster domain-containing protein [Archaeoglobus profundus]ADB57690.1 4Fe-4S ferredoxin iron-sulfur binding domain protein [Archaeoglobus profundus DSM 5631]